MRILALYGVNCRKEVWDGFKPYLQGHTVDYVEYPHEVTAEAKEVEDLTKWVYDTYKGNSYQAVIGHSLGGAIALQLATRYGMKFEHIIYLDTNLLPAGGFYRNLMTEEHMEQFGEKLMAIFQEERNYYTKELFDALQKEFDYSKEVMELNQKVYAIYGDRNQPEYSNRVEELMLPNDVLQRLELRFVPNACHMIMMENPEGLYQVVSDIISK